MTLLDLQGIDFQGNGTNPHENVIQCDAMRCEKPIAGRRAIVGKQTHGREWPCADATGRFSMAVFCHSSIEFPIDISQGC